MRQNISNKVILF